MSDEQTMPEVIYAWEVPGDCEKPQWDVEQPYFYNGTPYLRCPDNIDPDDAVVVSRKQRTQSDINAHNDAKRNHQTRTELLEAKATIATLTAERDARDKQVRELVEAVDRMIGHPDTKTFDTSLRVEMDTNLLVDVGNARNALAQLKEQDDA